jgi:enoyl-CoA hydratase
VIELTEQGGVAVMRLGDGKANAMSLEFCETLTARFKELSSSRAVVLTGTGRIFSAGVDLLRLSEGGASYVHKFLPALCAMFASCFPTRRRLWLRSMGTPLPAVACSPAPPTGG